jgi:hypothetical protein
MAPKRKPLLTDNLEGGDRFEADKLLALERLERDIASEEKQKRGAAADFRERIKELRKARDGVLDELEKFRNGDRALPLKGNVADAKKGKAEPGADG